MIVIRKAFPRIELRPGGKEDAWEAMTNGQNSLTCIWVWRDIPNMIGTLAQEIFEWRYRLTWGAIFAVIPIVLICATAVILGEPILFAAAIIVGVLAFMLGPRLQFIQRRKELISQEIEVQAHALYTGANADEYRRYDIGDRSQPELGGMIDYPWLDSMSEQQIEAAMKKNSARAKRWVQSNRGILDKAKTA